MVDNYNGSEDLVMNNRPPKLTEDFGITDEKDELDRELMPDKTVELNKSEKSS